MLTLRYNLVDLPTSQHRAGLAGLVMIARWIEARGPASFEVDVDAAGATVHLTTDGLAQLFDVVYAADEQPGKTDEDEARVVPRGAPISDGGVYIKLWRDVAWGVFRGVPATRASFLARLNGKAYNADARDVFEQLTKKPDALVGLSGCSLLGAQARTSELVPFRDTARNEFLLHFWPFAIGVYVSQTFTRDRGYNFARDYMIAVPDVRNLVDFCMAEIRALATRDTELCGYRPRANVVSSMEEAGLAAAYRLSHTGSGCVHGFDLFRVGREGKNVRVFETARSAPPSGPVQEYAALRERFHDATFRVQCVANMVRGAPWYRGFDRVLATSPAVETEMFRRDVGTALEGDVEESLSAVVREIVRRYLFKRAEKRLGVTWKAIMDNPKAVAEFNTDCRKNANRAYNAARSRVSSGAFAQFFTDTLCSVPQGLNEPRFELVYTALQREPGNVRMLTMLALSAAQRGPTRESEPTTTSTTEELT